MIAGLFSRISRLKVIVIGDVMIDAYLWGDVERISPEAPVPVVSVNRREHRLGGAGNVALNLKSIGAHPVLVSVTGNDEYGAMMKELLRQSGLSTSGIIQSSSRVTAVKTRILSRNHQMFRFDSETTEPLNDEDEVKVIRLVKRLLKKDGTGVVVFQDYNKGVLTPGIIRETIKECNALGIPTAVDPKKDNFFSYAGCTLFKPNLKELQEGTGLPLKKQDARELNEAVRIISERLGNKITLLTLSDAGVFVSENGRGRLLKAARRNVSDVSGAGDTVISVAAACLAAGADAGTIAMLANLAGGIVCEYVGVVPVEKNRLVKEASRLLK